MYRADTSKGDLQQTGTVTLPPPHRPSRFTRSSICTPRAALAAKEGIESWRGESCDCC